MSQADISSSDRIRELSAINSDVPALLASAGGAINALTGKTQHKATNGDTNGDVDMSDGGAPTESPVTSHKKAFTKHTTDYFTQLQSIMARLRRQAYALEEAGIIAAEAPTLSTISSVEPAQRALPGQGAGVRRGPPGMGAAPRPVAEEAERITNGGLGSLDVGYLNSRGNRVGTEKEAELIAEARKMLGDKIASR